MKTKSSKSVLGLCVALCTVVVASPAVAEGTCDNPESQTLCSSVCRHLGPCMDCCQTQYNNNTSSSWWLITVFKKIYWHSELQACKGNCISDTQSYIIVNPIDGSRVGSYLIYRYGTPTGGGYQYAIDFEDVADLTIYVSDPLDESTYKGRVEFRDASDKWTALVTQDASPRVQVETASGTNVIVDTADAIDSTGRQVFEDAVSPHGALYHEQLEEVVRMYDLGAPGMDGFGALLKDLLGM